MTVTLEGNLEAWVRQALTAAAGAVVEAMEEEAQMVADEARANWYSNDGVTRQTGKSGDIRVVTTVTPSEVRVGIGSTDDRVNDKGLPVALFVKRPGRLSLIRKAVDRDTWWGTAPAMRANYRPRRAGKANEADPAGSGPYIYEPNPLANDGKTLMVEFVRKPMTARVKVLSPKLRDAITAKMGGR